MKRKGKFKTTKKKKEVKTINKNKKGKMAQIIVDRRNYFTLLFFLLVQIIILI